MEEEEEAPETFTVAVGNLPPAAEVIVRITYLVELEIEADTYRVVFCLPAQAHRIPHFPLAVWVSFLLRH